MNWTDCKKALPDPMRPENMVTLEVGKRYKTEDGAVVHCVYMDSRAACPWFLLVVEKTNHPFWANGSGKDEHGINVVKKLPPRQTSAAYVNIYRHYNGELYMGEARYSLDEAKASALDGRVGVIPVELVNNIETGEVEG